jgi:3-methyladenine DNA glycosylase AlkD
MRRPAGDAPGRAMVSFSAAERARIVVALRAVGDPAEGESLRSYLGSPLPVLGVRTPGLRQVARDVRGRLGPAPGGRLLDLLAALWNGASYEERSVAIELLMAYPDRNDARTFRLADRWVDSATGWALSDSLAAGPIARMVAAEPGRFRELLRWTRSPNFWRRRAATYALGDWVRVGDLDRPFRLLGRLVADPEFWVQRAVGTWLRECWKKDRPRAERFLRQHVRALAPVAITVATERAPKRWRTELRRAHASDAPSRRRRPY